MAELIAQRLDGRPKGARRHPRKAAREENRQFSLELLGVAAEYEEVGGWYELQGWQELWWDVGTAQQCMNYTLRQIPLAFVHRVGNTLYLNITCPCDDDQSWEREPATPREWDYDDPEAHLDVSEANE